ncbi:MAG: hypothetical protein ABIQ18_03400 [Umezawaea sp.]
MRLLLGCEALKRRLGCGALKGCCSVVAYQGAAARLRRAVSDLTWGPLDLTLHRAKRAGGRALPDDKFKGQIPQVKSDTTKTLGPPSWSDSSQEARQSGGRWLVASLLLRLALVAVVLLIARRRGDGSAVAVRGAAQGVTLRA